MKYLEEERTTKDKVEPPARREPSRKPPRIRPKSMSELRQQLAAGKVDLETYNRWREEFK